MRIMVAILVLLSGFGLAQGFSLNTPEWRFVTNMFQQNEIVLTPCPEQVQSEDAQMLCGNYRWGSEGFMRMWKAYTEYHPPMPVTAVTDWQGSDGAYTRTFQVNDQELQVRIDGTLVTVNLRGS